MEKRLQNGINHLFGKNNTCDKKIMKKNNYIFDEILEDFFSPDGFNIEGFDRDGYDRIGFNKKGYNRDGKSFEEVKEELKKDGKTFYDDKRRFIDIEL